MTAIFAFAHDDVAFVVGDTMRNITFSQQVKAIKVHEWSDNVVFAQSGDGKFVSELISAMKCKKPQIDQCFRGYAEDEKLIEAFKIMRPYHYQNAFDYYSKLSSGAAHIVGTILVASAVDGHVPSRIHSLNFADGKVIKSSKCAEAHGQNPIDFEKYARNLLPTQYQSGSSFQIDKWGIDCISNAVNSYPKNIGWPAHMILARPATGSTGGERVTVARHVPDDSAAVVSDFLVTWR